jgi:hypothetical protein
MIEKVKESINSVEILISNAESFFENYVDYSWPKLRERLEEWKTNIQEIKDRLGEATRQKIYHKFNSINKEAVALKKDIQDEEVYKEFLLSQENNLINLKLLKGMFYEDLQETVSYDKHLIAIGNLTDGLKQTYEDKIVEIESNYMTQLRDLENLHREQIQKMTNEHTAEVQNLQSEKQQLREADESIIKDHKEKIGELYQKISDHKSEQDSLVRDHSEAIRDKDRYIESLKETNNELKDQIKSLKQTHKSLIHDLTSQNTKLSSNVDALQIKIETLKQAHKEGMEQLRIQNGNLEAENDDLKNHKSNLETEIIGLKNENNDLKHQKDNLESENVDLKNQKDNLATTNGDLTVRIANLEANENNLNNQNDIIKTEIDTLEKKVKDQVNENNLLKKEYSTQVSKLSSKNKELENKLKNVTQEYKEFFEIVSLRDNPSFSGKEELRHLFKEVNSYPQKLFGKLEELKDGSEWSYSLLNIICKIITNDSEHNYDPSSNIKINCKNEKNKTLLKVFSCFTLPKLSGFAISGIPVNDETVMNSLCNLSFSGLSGFSFNGSSDGLIDISAYAEGLKQVAESSTINQFKISNWKMNSEQVVQIISSAKKWYIISLNHWLLQLDGDIDFSDSLDGAKFKVLKLEYSGDEVVDDWVKIKTNRKDTTEFEFSYGKLKVLLKGLGKVKSVRDNFDAIYVISQKILTRYGIMKMLEDVQLENVMMFFNGTGIEKINPKSVK